MPLNAPDLPAPGTPAVEPRPQEPDVAGRSRAIGVRPPQQFARATTVMLVLTSLASIANYGSNLIFSRMLTPASYGDMTALLACAVLVAVPTAAAQTVLADRIAVHMAEGRYDRVRYLIRHAMAHIGVVAFAIGVVYTAAIPVVDKLLDLQTVGPALALAPLIVLSFFLPAVY